MPKPTLIDLSVILVHRTENAVLVKDTETSAPVWLPLSLVEVDGNVGEVGEVTLPEWLAQERGLI